MYDICMGTGLDTIGNLKDYRLKVLAEPERWDNYKLSKEVSKDSWKCVKYFNSKGMESADFRAITNEHGGVFLWIIMPQLIPVNNCSYVAYIGESEKNLARSIHNFIKSSESLYNGQLSICQLFERYSKYLHLVYYESDEIVFSREVASKLSEAIQPLIKYIPIRIQQTGEAF